jgi:hypothetical protein
MIEAGRLRGAGIGIYRGRRCVESGVLILESVAGKFGSPTIVRGVWDGRLLGKGIATPFFHTRSLRA